MTTAAQAHIDSTTQPVPAGFGRWLRVTGLALVALAILASAIAFVPAAAAGDGHAMKNIAVAEIAIFITLVLIVARSGRDRKPARIRADRRG